MTQPIQSKTFGWVVSGCNTLYRGEFAEYDANEEAAHCGGTAKAIPLYTAQDIPTKEKP